MPHLVRERLYYGDIRDAIAALTGSSSAARPFTHVLSVVSSASISFIAARRPGLAIPAQEIRRVVAGQEGAPPAASVPSGELLWVVERAGDGLRVTRMAVPLRDQEDADLLDRLEPCLDFIDEGRMVGDVLVHCSAGVSRSASIITAYLMRSEQKSLVEAFQSLKGISRTACPNDGFLDQLQWFEEMGFRVDPLSPLYKRFCIDVDFGRQKLISKTWAPKMCQTFLERAVRYRYWTAGRLALRRVSHPERCKLCDQDLPETMQHLLSTCTFSRQVWFSLLQQFGLQELAPTLEDDVFCVWWVKANSLVAQPLKAGLNSLIALGAWMIWQHATECRRNGASPSIEQVLHLAGQEARQWVLDGAMGLSQLVAQILFRRDPASVQCIQ